jgi:uncharacterized protein (DUF1778 family)
MTEKKTKMGRPRLPKKLAKGALLSVRFLEDERLLLDQAAKRAGISVSAWARNVLLAEAARSVQLRG